MAVSFQPWYVGDTDPAWDLPLQNDAGTENITGWDITAFTMTFRTTTGIDTPGTGTFSRKIDYPNPEVYYQMSDLDVANPFSGQLFVKAINPATGKRVVWDPFGGLNGGPFVISPS